MNKFTIIFSFFLSLHIFSYDAENFVNDWVGGAECSDSFVEFYDNHDNYDLLYEGVELSGQDKIIHQEIFDNFCSNLDRLEKAANISKILFSSESENIFPIYSLHTDKFPEYVTFSQPQDGYNFIVKEINLFIDQLEKEYIDPFDLKLLIRNFSWSIQQLDLTQFKDGLTAPLEQHDLKIFALFGYLENLILDNVSSNLDYKTLESIANDLLQIRVARLNTITWFGSTLEKYALREEFINIYFKGFFDNKIKYTEFQDIFNKQSGGDSNDKILELTLTIDQALDLYFVNINTSQLTKDNTKSNELYYGILDEFLINNFDLDPETIILNLVSGKNINPNVDLFCKLKSKQLPKKIENFYNIDASLNVLKFNCAQEVDYLLRAIKNLNLNIQDMKSSTDINNIGFEEFNTYEDSYIYATEILNLLTIEDSSFFYELKPNEYEILFGALIDFYHDYLSKFDTSKKINSLKPGINLNMFWIMINLLSEESNKLNNASISKLKQIESIAYEFKYDFINIKQYIDEKINTDKNFDPTGRALDLQTLQFMIWRNVEQISPIVPFNMADFIEQLESFDTKSTQIQELKESIDFLRYLSLNLDKFFVEMQLQFILRNASMDRWFLFKELISLEIYLRYSLMQSGHYPMDFFYYESELINEVLKYRPDQLAIEKYKETFFKKSEDSEFKNILRNYDQVQRSYKTLNEISVLAEKDVLSQSLNQINDDKRYLINQLYDLQSELFSDIYEDELTDLYFLQTMNLNHIQDTLSEDTALVSFVSGFVRSFGIVITKDDKRLFPIAVPRISIEDLSSELKSTYVDAAIEIDVLLASSLYDQIFYPAELFLKEHKINKIHIISDESFSLMPIHALYDSESKMWVQEKYNLSYLSSEKIYSFLDKSIIDQNNALYGFGNPALSNKTLIDDIDQLFSKRGEIEINSITELYELPETEVELDQISKGFKSKKLYIQNEATERNFFNEKFDNAEVIAFASHAVRGKNNFITDRGIVLTPVDSNDINNDGFLSSLEIKSRNFDSNPIILLNACSTLEQSYFYSETFTGLPSSFIEAGAKGVLVSLWDVDSNSAVQYNKLIFENRNVRFDAVDAINDATNSMISSEKFSHPYYWAPYVYFGK